MATIRTTTAGDHIKAVIRKGNKRDSIDHAVDPSKSLTENHTDAAVRLSHRTGWISKAAAESPKATHKTEGDTIVMSFPNI